ncbi:hypothetical protein J7L36_01380 [bacterium]|nr:hypothetical protein [bacterium]
MPRMKYRKANKKVDKIYKKLTANWEFKLYFFEDIQKVAELRRIVKLLEMIAKNVKVDAPKKGITRISWRSGFCSLVGIDKLINKNENIEDIVIEVRGSKKTLRAIGYKKLFSPMVAWDFIKRSEPLS